MALQKYVKLLFLKFSAGFDTDETRYTLLENEIVTQNVENNVRFTVFSKQELLPYQIS